MAPPERLAMVLEAALKGQDRVLSKILKLSQADVDARRRHVEYVRAVAAAGCAVLATSSDDLELAPGMRVRLSPDGDGNARWGMLHKPLYTGTGLAKCLTGWAVKVEAGGTEGASSTQVREVALDDLPSQRGIKIWAHLPLQEFRAVAPHRSSRGKENTGKRDAPARQEGGAGGAPGEGSAGARHAAAGGEPAAKRLLDYAVGDTFLLRGEGYTSGWVLAARVPRQVQGGNESLHIGNVKWADLEEEPLAPETTQQW